MNSGFADVVEGVFFTVFTFFLVTIFLESVFTAVFLLVDGFFAGAFVAFFIISYPLASWQYIIWGL
jgi:hypothetical protein